MPDNLSNSFKRLDRTLKKKQTEYSGELGTIINGIQHVEVPNRNGFHYVSLNSNTSELIQAYNDKTSPIYGMPVKITWNVNRYEVLGKDDLRYGEWNSNYLPKHGNQHSFNPDGGGGGDVSFIYGKQFVPLSLTPSGSFGASVGIIAPYSHLNNGWHYVPNTITPNIVTHKPTNNQGKMVLVCMDFNTYTPQLIIGTGTFNANLTGSADVIPYLPSTTGVFQIPIAGVRLVSGTTAVTWQNIYDVRQYFHPIFTGTSSGGGSAGGTGSAIVGSFYSNTTDLVVNGASVNPINLGGTSFNDNLGTLSGNKVTLLEDGKYNILLNVEYTSTSGTIKNGTVNPYIRTTNFSFYDPALTVTGTAGITYDVQQVETIAQMSAGEQIWASFDNNSGGSLDVGVVELSIFKIAPAGSSNVTQAFSVGMMGWDEGSPLGTGTVLNFVGAGVTTTLSGTVFNISVPGGGGSSIDTLGFAGLDEGVPIGTGTFLNVVGGGATITRSGTMFELNVPSAGVGPAGAPGAFGVMGQDEGINLGTGTTLNFVGAGVTATISGTVLNVNVAGGGGTTPGQVLSYPTTFSGDVINGSSTTPFADVVAFDTKEVLNSRILHLVTKGASKDQKVRVTLGTTKADVFDISTCLAINGYYWASAAGDYYAEVRLATSADAQLAIARIVPSANPVTSPFNYMEALRVGGAAITSINTNVEPKFSNGNGLTLRFTRDSSNAISFYYGLGTLPMPMNQVLNSSVQPYTVIVSGTLARVEYVLHSPAGPTSTTQIEGFVDYLSSV